MRIFIRIFFVLVLCLSFSTSAYCIERTTYFSGSVGLAMLNDADVYDPLLSGANLVLEYEPGYFLSVAFGHDSPETNFRAELEVGYQKNNIDTVSIAGSSMGLAEDQEIRLVTFLVNMYYDFTNRSAFTPYLTAGLGLGNMKIKGASSSDAVAAYQFGAGVSFQMSKRFALDLKIRHLETSDGEFDTTSVDYATNNAIFAVRGYF